MINTQYFLPPSYDSYLWIKLKPCSGWLQQENGQVPERILKFKLQKALTISPI